MRFLDGKRNCRIWVMEFRETLIRVPPSIQTQSCKKPLPASQAPVGCAKMTKKLVADLPTHVGNMSSLLIWTSIQSIRRFMYWGAGRAVGFLYLRSSCHRYSYLGPPDITGQVCSVQNSQMVP